MMWCCGHCYPLWHFTRSHDMVLWSLLSSVTFHTIMMWCCGHCYPLWHSTPSWCGSVVIVILCDRSTPSWCGAVVIGILPTWHSTPSWCGDVAIMHALNETLTATTIIHVQFSRRSFVSGTFFSSRPLSFVCDAIMSSWPCANLLCSFSNVEYYPLFPMVGHSSFGIFTILNVKSIKDVTVSPFLCVGLYLKCPWEYRYLLVYVPMCSLWQTAHVGFCLEVLIIVQSRLRSWS